ncbi:MAG: sulfite exporter TauE/SafE family protein [Hydrocarboniphaga sp.]|uniref:sulfite exporter TauE/SafE family protein n=1 Tax=Hydrocarboniphaga sp. TaxID=2033016 RepID=UPI0026026F14|nr:sulfite exporter TauE/SafE family protein [Hydrocarboniphaga sp.]MDB5971680.1 sulfite exporter TauE/SafE family protein [Hydrocarboniphaga sp.]
MSIAIGIVVGLMLGLTGAGGSVFAVPLLMLGMHWTLPQAAPVALIAVCAAAAFGTVAAWDVSYVRYRAAMLMSLVGLVTAPLGLLAAAALPGAALTTLFAAVLVIVALRMMLQARRHPEEAQVVRATVAGDGTPSGGPLCRIKPGTGRLLWTRTCTLTIAAIGALTGFLSGLLGVGGGFVIVPSLRASSELSVHSAVATSLMAIALTSAGTVLVSLLLGRTMLWAAAVPFVIGALAGMFAGRRIAPRIAGPLLQQGFAAMMLGAAGVLMMKSL